MNIFKILFRQKKLLTSPGTGLHSHERYLAPTLRAIKNCDSIPDLASYLRDYSGYVREAAIARCVELGASELLPSIVQRLNDWVPQVRHAARFALMTLLPFTPIPQLLATLSSVLRLRNASRADHAAWITQFELEFVRRVDVKDIIDGAQGRDVMVSRACFQILKSQNLVDLPLLISMMLRANEDIVLAIQAIDLCASLPAESQFAKYEAAAKSHFGAVRTLALRTLLATESNADRDTLAIDALFDVQTSARAVAMTYLKTRQFDMRTFYCDALQGSQLSAKHAQVALASLASLNAVGDLPLIERYTTSSFPSVRKAAFSAWVKIADRDKDSIALGALKDEAPSVRKFALQVVTRQGAYIPFDLLRTILEEKGDLTLFLSFCERSKWNWLEGLALISMQTASDAAIRPVLHEGLRTWAGLSGKLFDGPTVKQVQFFSSPDTEAALEDLAGNENMIKEVLRLELSQIIRRSA